MHTAGSLIALSHTILQQTKHSAAVFSSSPQQTNMMVDKHKTSSPIFTHTRDFWKSDDTSTGCNLPQSLHIAHLRSDTISESEELNTIQLVFTWPKNDFIHHDEGSQMSVVMASS